MTLTIAAIEPADARFAGAAALLDAYRVHYGQTPDPDGVRTWLAAQVELLGLTVTAAVDGGTPCGVVTSLLVPATWRLGIACSVRDMFVAPEHRGRGVGRAMLLHVIDAARAAGAVRVSLRTESENAQALALYRGLGFVAKAGLESLDLPLLPRGGGTAG